MYREISLTANHLAVYIPPAKCGSDGDFARRRASGRKHSGRLGLHGRLAMRSTADLTDVIRHLRVPAGDGPGDLELLERYARGHDQAAFATLVRRYGPLVLGVVRRQLSDRHLAEDVFQATF